MGAKLGSVMDLEDRPRCSIFSFYWSAEEGFMSSLLSQQKSTFFNEHFQYSCFFQSSFVCSSPSAFSLVSKSLLMVVLFYLFYLLLRVALVAFSGFICVYVVCMR